MHDTTWNDQDYNISQNLIHMFDNASQDVEPNNSLLNDDILSFQRTNDSNSGRAFSGNDDNIEEYDAEELSLLRDLAGDESSSNAFIQSNLFQTPAPSSPVVYDNTATDGTAGGAANAGAANDGIIFHHLLIYVILIFLQRWTLMMMVTPYSQSYYQ